MTRICPSPVVNEKLIVESLLQQLNPAARGKLDELVVLESVDSTNDYLLKLAHRQQVIACFAEQQTAGKGQRGKRWVCPPNGQIYASLLWQFPNYSEAIMGLSLAAGVAVARALRHYGVGAGLGLKWPNDVYFQGRKLAGILIETTPGASGVCNAVIGVGVNLEISPEQAAAIDQPWASLNQILPVERNRFAGLLLNEILLALTDFSAKGLAPFQAEWHGLDYLYDKRVNITSGQHTVMGIMNGISAKGELLLTDDQNRQHICLNGSVRLAG